MLIVGGGTAGWMAAAGLSRALGRTVSVQVLDLPGLADSGVLAAAESSLPALRAFHALIGLEEDALVRRTGATFKLGTRFEDWTGDGSAYLHPLGDYGATLDGVPFNQLWMRLSEAGAAEPLAAYSLAAVAAGLGRFARPDGDPRSVTSTMSYGLHLDVAAYAAEVRALAQARGVARVEGDLGDVERRPDGFVSRLRLTDGRTLEADLFVDWTGQAARLAVCGFEDWDGWLGCDRLIGAQAPADPAAPLLTRTTALSVGWRQEIPLRGRTVRTLAYSSRFTSDDDARRLVDGTVVAFRPGRRTQPWRGNCVAIGLAAAAIEPLEAGGLHIVQSGVSKLIGLFPDRSFGGGEAGEYNRLMGEELDRLRDLAIAHHKLNGRDGALWEFGRGTGVPAPLAHKMRLFESRGRVVLYDEETFLEPDWISVFMGQGLIPRRRHPMADATPLPALRSRVDRIGALMRQAAEAMPPHAELLERIAR
jgi:tryptophan halogenase